MRTLLLTVILLGACADADIPLISHEYECSCDAADGTHLAAHACQPSEEAAYDAFLDYLSQYDAHCDTVTCKSGLLSDLCF